MKKNDDDDLQILRNSCIVSSCFLQYIWPEAGIIDMSYM